MSDDSDAVQNRRKRKTFLVEDSSDSDSSVETTRRKRKKHRRNVRDSESDSSIEVHKKRVGRVTSDTGESSSGSEIIRSKRQVATLASDSNTSTSDSEYDSDWVTEPERKTPETKPVFKNDSSSESGDDQLEKCPICLLPFKNQEVGSPEACDHSFCIDCILEWSKNINTCPVDRQIYNLILVRSNYNGKIIKQIPIEAPQPQNSINEIVEDPTFCEICGSCEREDRMLLCDGCDLGFHLECLNPPLEDVPAGLWFCPDCGPGDEDHTVDIYEVHLLLEDAETLGWPSGPRSRNSTSRLVPRTRQSERVRARVITHRNQTQRNESTVRQERGSRPGPSGSVDANAPVSNRSNRRRKKKGSKKSRIRITYEIDQATGERIAIETKIKHRRKRKTRKQRERARMAAQAARSVKGRLALQLGMCPIRTNGPAMLENRTSEHTRNIGYQRSQAGIPTLDLFGRRDDLDYYGGTDSEEDISNANLLIRRRPQTSDVTLFRRAARRKALIAPSIQRQDQLEQSMNVLDSILDIQSKFHSKNSVLSLNRDGSVKIDSKDSSFNDKNNNDKGKDKNSSKNGNRINLNDYSNAYFRQTPLYGNGSPSSQSAYNNNADFTRRSSVDNRNAVSTSSEQILHGSTSNDREEDGPSYSVQRVCSSFEYDADKKDKDKDKSQNNSPHNSDSELDIYSDIETVSTSRAEEFDPKATSPAIALTPNTPTDEDANNSDGDLVIDTEKGDDSKEQVSSTVDLVDPIPSPHSLPTSSLPNTEAVQIETLEIQNQTVQSTNSKIGNEKDDKEEEEDDDSEDGCPNFSIYSSESMNIAKTTDLQLLSDKESSNQTSNDHNTAEVGNENIDEIVARQLEIPEAAKSGSSGNDEPPATTEKYSYSKPGNMHCGLYSDSDDETLIKITKMPFGNEEKAAEESEVNAVCATSETEKNTSEASENTTKIKKPFALGDISTMTEDISEEERSYTPCLDERVQKQGLEGLDTEMISDEERNDFDESHELKTASDGDALEINAKESELDFTGGKPEDYEEGEIVDKLKNKKPLAEHKNPPQEKEPEKEEATEEINKEVEPTQASFKKLSKNNKERNYRDKDKENVRSKSKEKKSDKESKKERKREKRKELERYNVRSMIAEKPRRVRDKFGRDESRRKSLSRSSRSLTPPVRRSLSRPRSYSRERAKKRRARTKSRSRTPPERRRLSRSPRTRRQRSASRERPRGKWRRSRERYNSKSRQSASPRRRREWIGRSSKGWSRSLSRSYTPEQRLTPSWTPPRLLESQPVKPQNLTVILNNDHNKKKKEKRKKEKRKEMEKTRKRKRNKTPPPSKEVFASGNNILVSVSFNKDTNQRDVINKRKRDLLEDSLTKKRKTKEKRKNDNKRKKKRKDLAGVKPVAIIDLERSPFREVTPSPEDVIVLTDSENAESNDMLGLQKAICDSSQQVASPERPMNANYLISGPKTPPEPQVKFTLNAKQTQIRAISNPLHEPDDIEGEIDPQEELEQRLNESLHKGPNTPPEPPNSPPSSPDAYDPFEPTKSRSPTPEPLPPVVQLSSTSQNDSVREESLIDSRNDDDETIDQSHTPPVTDIQPADSQCSNIKPISPEKSPEQHTIGVVINRVVQAQAALFPSVVSKTISSFSNTSMVTSTPLHPVNILQVPPRINILNSTVLTPTTIASALPQRIVLPNTTKSSPVKVSPNKIPIKSTPIKPMPAKNLMNKSNKSARKSNNHNSNENFEALLDFESPYSPGSSDYEDLFEPPAPGDVSGTKSANVKQSAQKGKDQSTFDILFGTSPVNNSFKNKSKSKGSNNVSKYKKNSKGTKQVGVKIDEDTLKILDELPNSAVEMQVKNKYLKKLNRQERVVEEVKLVLKPHYNKKHINKEEYKDILRRSVPKICHNKSGEINPQKIQNLIEAYVKKIRHSKKVTSSSSVNPQKA